MRTSKLTVSVPSEVLAEARNAVKRGRAPSLSAYVTSALCHRVTLDDLEALLDDMLAETGGPLTRSERAAADGALVKQRRTSRSAGS